MTDIEGFYKEFGDYIYSCDIKLLNNELYQDDLIKITFHSKDDFGLDAKCPFLISGIEFMPHNESDQNIGKFIDSLRKNIELNVTEKLNGFDGEVAHWQIFYLLKEIITKLKGIGYNYYRGQSHDWPTLPGIFRSLCTAEGKLAYEEFEMLYRNVSREFPEELEYISLEGLKDKDLLAALEKREDQISILQHYGMKTPLIDITSNPFIAMQFMLSSDELDIPRLEFYKINEGESTLFSSVRKMNKNKRIRAQKGAFLNYDNLYPHLKIENGHIKLHDYQPIKRVIVKLVFDEENKDLDKKTHCYNMIANRLTEKLNEFGYSKNNLYPDFSDFVAFQGNRYFNESSEFRGIHTIKKL